MTKCTSSLVLLSLLALGLHISPAEAQLARTFVSSFGNDSNGCNRMTPCRTFQRAHDNILANGEITVLDPGGYSLLIGNGITWDGQVQSFGDNYVAENRDANLPAPLGIIVKK